MKLTEKTGKTSMKLWFDNRTKKTAVNKYVSELENNIPLSTFTACLTLEGPPGPSVLVAHTVDPTTENLDH